MNFNELPYYFSTKFDEEPTKSAFLCAFAGNQSIGNGNQAVGNGNQAIGNGSQAVGNG